MESYMWLLTVCVLYTRVQGTQNNCLVYDFESDLDEFKYDTVICEPFPLWTIGNYSETGVESPNSNSKSFISPTLDMSCISSATFKVSDGGVVEINVYMEGRSPADVVSVLLMMSSSDHDLTVSNAMLSPSLSDTNGWHTLKLQSLDGLGEFDGYLTFLGTKSDESIILIDSFRYVPNTVDEKSCTIYEDEIENVDNGCVSYNFENSFDVLFTTDNYLCDGFLSWNWESYATRDVDSPNDNSSLFISPGQTLSCVSSFVFNMEPNGVIEANVYMDPMSDLDNIIVIAQKVTSQEVDTVAGFTMYYPQNRKFVAGWNLLSFIVEDFVGFDGYLILFGSAAEGSVVLVDSVRYIPPSLSTIDGSCPFY